MCQRLQVGPFSRYVHALGVDDAELVRRAPDRRFGHENRDPLGDREPRILAVVNRGDVFGKPLQTILVGLREDQLSLGSLAEPHAVRSEEQPSELQSLMRIPYALFCWKQKTPL